MEINDELKSNISSTETWLRLLLTIGLGILTSVVMMPVVWVLAGVQLIFQLFTGQANENLHDINRNLSAWLNQVFRYMLLVSDVKPFPFSDLPELEPEIAEAEIIEPSVDSPDPQAEK